jgi:hypothetical protein
MRTLTGSTPPGDGTMSTKLRHYVYDTYAINGHRYFKKVTKRYPIQFDDQDDSDVLSDFCNVFVLIGRNNMIRVELAGTMPVTREMRDFVEIYDGSIDKETGRLSLCLNPDQIEALYDLAALIRRTAESGDRVGNANWRTISARTVSTLYRFVRVIKEYKDNKRMQLQ